VRIGLVTDFYYPWIGGPSAVVRNLSHGLAARGHTVVLLAPSADGPPTVETDGPVEVRRVSTVPVPFGYNVRASGLPFSTVTDWLRSAAPDVVHVHHPFPLSAAAVYGARSSGIPAAATNHTIPECSLWGLRNLGPLYHGARFAFGRWIVHLLHRCSAVATPTDTAAQALHVLGYSGPVVTISNGVDVGRFSPGSVSPRLRRRLGLDERPVVLYTGRLDAEKQMDVWIRAAVHTSRRIDAQFVVGGQGTARPSLVRLAAELGVADRIRFIGYLDEPDLPDLYRLADVYFITSPVELQSIGTLEAIASGLPVVAVRAGALPELVRDGDNGRLVPPGDSAAATESLVDLLSDAGLRARMSLRSRSRALAHDLERSIDSYERFLLAVSGGDRRVLA